MLSFGLFARWMRYITPTKFKKRSVWHARLISHAMFTTIKIKNLNSFNTAQEETHNTRGTVSCVVTLISHLKFLIFQTHHYVSAQTLLSQQPHHSATTQPKSRCFLLLVQGDCRALACFFLFVFVVCLFCLSCVM